MQERITKIKLNKEIRDAIKAKKLLLGRNRVMKSLKNSNLITIVYASNTPENMKRDMVNYSKLSGIKLQAAPINSAELGELCGKPFHVLITGIKK